MILIMFSVTLFLLIVAIVWKLIDWRNLAIKWVGNNPERAQVYCKAGDTVRTVQGERFYTGAEGDMYLYCPDKINLIAICPRGSKKYPENNYPYYYIRGRRIIGIEDGYVVASPLGFMPKEMIGKYVEATSNVAATIEGNVHVKAIHSLKNLKGTSWLIYLIIAAVVIGGIFYYYNSHNKQAPATANVTQASQIPAPVPGQQLQPIQPSGNNTLQIVPNPGNNGATPPPPPIK